MALTHAAADRLLRRWAEEELHAIRKVWYPASSPGYRKWEPPLDPEAVRVARGAYVRDEFEIHRTGWCLICLRRVHREALRRHYLSAIPVGHRARGAALSAFCRVWGEWLDVLDDGAEIGIMPGRGGSTPEAM